MKWEKTTIGEHCVVTSSKRFHLSERSKDGIPFYCSKEIIQKCKGEEITDCDHIREDFYNEVSKKFGVPQANDLLVTTRGTIGIPYLYRPIDKFYFADGNLTWMKDFKDTLLPKYLYYWFLSYEGREKVNAIAKGTAQKAVPIAGIKLLEITIPPVETQKRIVDILSAYDDLIENNQKQIKLLEEAAQRLYKEWFVDLHFPGYENTKIVDGVPEGWEYGLLDKLANFKRGKTITKNQVKEGIIPVVAGGLEPAYYHNIANTVAPVITISASGANAGYTRMYYTSIWASDCSFADINVTENLYYIYCFLKENKEKITSLQKGAAQPHVYARDINALELLLPPSDILRIFNQFTEKIFIEIGKLEKQTITLQQTREYLLPKLMNGEIEV